MQPLLALPNLSSPDVFEVEPWSLALTRSDFKSKKAFMDWCLHPTTDHCFLSSFEGLNPHVRVSKGNLPFRMRALLVDYDYSCPSTEAALSLISAAPGDKPTWVSRSFSGGIHVMFELEESVEVLTEEVRGRFLKKLSKHLKLSKLLPGLDTNFLEDGMTYLEVGTEWAPVPESGPLRRDVVSGCLLVAIEQSKFQFSGWAEIPFDVLEREVAERFPGRWSGPFIEGARGVRFWDETADAQSVVLKKTGAVCFTGDRKFLPWRDIFGSHFVDQYEVSKTSAAIDGTYWDGREYWKQDITSKWFSLRRDDLYGQLKVNAGLTTASNGGGASDIDRAIVTIQEVNRIDAAIPYVSRPAGIFTRHGKRFLNISATECLQPAEIDEPDESNFPWIANFLDNLFDPAEQLDFFLAWTKRFYEGCLTKSPKQGHTLFLAGDVNQGKTLLSNILLSDMVGGHMEASRFLMGDTAFNKELFHTNLWTMDDNTPASDSKRQARYSSIVKKMAANQAFEYHPKFKDPTMIEWSGRVVVTCNVDPESIRILPDLDQSISEKVSALKISTKSPAERGFNGSHVEILRKELPCFCKWLLLWETPSWCLGDPRYGVKNYIHKDLEESAADSAESTSFHEIIDIFLTSWKVMHPKESEWRGNSAKLVSDMSNDLTTRDLVGKYTPAGVSRMMRKLSTTRPELIKYHRNKSFREWIIKI